MDIKAAAAGTKLNDRAVKIYMLQGLVSPEKIKDASCGKRFEFSHEDVEKLKCIDVLRRLGMTFKQIKTFDGGGDKARTLLAGIAMGEIPMKVACYINKPADGAEVTLKSASRLLAPFVPEGAVNPDLESTRGQSAYMVFVLTFVPLALLGILWESYHVIGIYSGYIYPVFNGNFFTLCILLTIPVAAWFAVMLFIRGLKSDAVAPRRVSTVLITGFLVLHLLFSPITVMISGFIPFIDNRTDDPGDYLKFGDEMSVRKLNDIFPEDISLPGTDGTEFAETTKYHYEFTSVIDPECDVYAEWVPGDEVFDSEVARLTQIFGEAETKSVGGYSVYTLKSTGVIKQFAYNEDIGVIMYGYATRYEWSDTYFDRMLPKS